MSILLQRRRMAMLALTLGLFAVASATGAWSTTIGEGRVEWDPKSRTHKYGKSATSKLTGFFSGVITPASGDDEPRSVGIKVLDISRPGEREKAELEIQMLKACKGLPNVIQYLGHAHNDEKPLIYIVTEYYGGQDFFKFNVKISLEEKIQYLIQLFSSLACMHKRNVIHRDIKPANIMAYEGEAYFIDLGDGVQLEPSSDLNKIISEMDKMKHGGTRGTPEYYAPETAGNKCRQAVKDEDLVMLLKKYDVWALSATAVWILAGKYFLTAPHDSNEPFDEKDPAELQKNRDQTLNELRELTEDNVSGRIEEHIMNAQLQQCYLDDPGDSGELNLLIENIFEILRGGLTVDVNKRLSAHEMATKLAPVAGMLPVPEVEPEV